MEKDLNAQMEVLQSAFHKKMIANGYKRFTDSAQFLTEKVSVEKSLENQAPIGENKNLVAIIGDRFMNGGFVTNKELKKCYKQWEGTLHDINHMGTSTGFFLAQTDITYFIGYHKNVKYHANDKSVSMELEIHEKTEFAQAWQAYIELCEMAGRIPNVSVTYYGKQEWVRTDKLPPEADWKAEGYGKDDLVPVLSNIVPVCVSTVLQGRCNDKDGCGIRNTNSTNCGSDSCDCGGKCSCAKAELDKETKKKIQEQSKALKTPEIIIELECIRKIKIKIGG